MGISHNSLEIFGAELLDLVIEVLGQWENGQDQMMEQDTFKAYKRSMQELCILLWGCLQAAQVLMLLREFYPLGTLFVLNAGWKILLSSPWQQQIVTKCFSLISLCRWTLTTFWNLKWVYFLLHLEMDLTWLVDLQPAQSIIKNLCHHFCNAIKTLPQFSKFRQ